jgi:hypothetical protein
MRPATTIESRLRQGERVLFLIEASRFDRAALRWFAIQLFAAVLCVAMTGALWANPGVIGNARLGAVMFGAFGACALGWALRDLFRRPELDALVVTNERVLKVFEYWMAEVNGREISEVLFFEERPRSQWVILRAPYRDERGVLHPELAIGLTGRAREVAEIIAREFTPGRPARPHSPGATRAPSAAASRPL